MELIQQFRPLSEVEREHILRTLAHCDGNRTRAAGILSISLRSLRGKLHDYIALGISVPSPSNGINRSEQPHHSRRRAAA